MPSSISSLRSLLTNSRGSKFLGDLEEYIDRTKKGYGALDSNVPQKLSGKLTSTTDYLSKFNPKALEQYSGYLTGLTYDKRGRFVSNIDDNLAQMAKITGPLESDKG